MTQEEQNQVNHGSHPGTPAVLTADETAQGFTINAEGKVVNAQGVVVR